jgi:NADH-quinone oxidoreductase subunit L
MAGPTPVSALIHAATMVTAGVYMVARSSSIFLHSAYALDIVAIVGLATAFFAATMGLAQTDIKKVYAYSTVSQLGYMFLGLGTGAFSAGIYHVMTHAFFKALLFLGAGSVIHAMSGEQDMYKMGGLRKYTPITFVVLLCASLAIAGFPFLSGYYSKDMILEAAYEHEPWMYWVGVFTAGMTAFYVFRAFFLTFFGEERWRKIQAEKKHDTHGAHGHDDHGHGGGHGHGDAHGHGEPHESPLVMWGPLAVLAILSLIGGWAFNVPRYLEPLFPLHEGEAEIWLTVVSVAFGLGGIALAYIMYVASPGMANSLASTFSLPYRWIYNKYFVDELYDAAIVNPMVDGSRALLWRAMDAGGIDGLVNGIGRWSMGLGGLLKRAQSGYIRSYAAWVTLGAILVIAAISMMGGGR